MVKRLIVLKSLQVDVYILWDTSKKNIYGY